MTAPRYADRRAYPTYVFVFKGDLVLNAKSDLLPGNGKTVANLVAAIKTTAPTGAAVIIGFHLVTLSTGAVAAAFATLTLPIAAFTATKDITGVVIGTDQALVVTIDQIGNVLPGTDLTVIAR